MRGKRWLSALAVLLVTGNSGVLRAWKTRLGTGTVHGWQAERAGQLLRLRTPGNAQEWDRFTHTVFLACGTLGGDGNSHGNALPTSERKDPDGGVPISEDALTFNGGPMFRWWVRALEAHGQVDSGLPRRYQAGVPFPMGADYWRRSSPSNGTAVDIRRPGDVYRYLGFMVHLVQDNTSPAHMANVRHGPWDGVEWWHWDKLSVGGYGVNEPEEAERLQARYGAWMDGEILTKNNVLVNRYWKKELIISNKRGTNGDNRYDYESLTDQFFDAIIKSNRALVMPGVQEKVKTTKENYFEPFSGTVSSGRRPSPEKAQEIWEWEHSRSIAGNLQNAIGSGPEWASPLVPAFPPPSGAGQVRILPEGTHGISLGGAVISFDTYSERPSLRWQNLNDQTSPWLPSPKYKGEGFDARWGSYGGYWGFPGRIPIEGNNPAIDIGADLLTRGKGRITPGDLYTVHGSLGHYNDRELSSHDERFLDPIVSPLATTQPNGFLAQFGLELLNRSALWSAVVMESFSQALPPLIARFTLEPRKISGPAFSEESTFPAWYDQRVLPWCAGTLGAKITVQLDLNRKDDYAFEIYAIPRQSFKERRNWRRSITLGNTIWPSDLSVTEEGGPDVYPTRDYDYAYSQLVGYPLVLTRGFKPVLEANFLNTDPSAVLPEAIPITTGELVFLVTPTDPISALADRYCWTSKAELNWTGEVRDPIRIVNEAGEAGGPAPSGMETPPPEEVRGKKLLPSADYLLLLVSYRKGWRPAFARNQFKFLTPSKEVLEFSSWHQNPWTQEFIKEAIAASRGPGARSDLIPDELCPLRIDTRGPATSIE